MTQAAKTQTTPSKRVVFTMGGKGGVGKTGVMVALAEWFAANEIPVTPVGNQSGSWIRTQHVTAREPAIIPALQEPLSNINPMYYMI